ncbi:MAG: type I-F CRISPR-associated protein Csy1 [Gammaproteobacteria bacterium]|nr:type I-F CRISPR-associated protein Csy1 [Gammaproteobacteria bacterium]
MVSEHAEANQHLEIRAIIDAFIQERLHAKLDKLKVEEEDKRQALLAEHQRDVWLADAARRVSQLQLVTHTLKPLHPDARGTSLYLQVPLCDAPELVATHTLGNQRADDVVGNAAALDVYKLLKLDVGQGTLLQQLRDGDAATVAALSDDPALASQWAVAFLAIAQSKSAVASHTLARQIYFPLATGGYHLLAPLFPTSLVHRLHQQLQQDRFDDSAKAARAAKAKGESFAHGYSDYPNLLAQKFGGSKPQNISQLNSERGGNAYLLPSLPPMWQSIAIKPPLRHVSVFLAKRGAFARRPQVRQLTRSLHDFLARAADWNNKDIRDSRSRLVQAILEELTDFVLELQALTPGWSRDPQCRLDVIEQRWLDPLAGDAELDGDWRGEVASRFSRWLNAEIATDKTPMGDDEFHQWKQEMLAMDHRLREERSHEL